MSVAVPVIDYMDVTTKRIHLLQGVTSYHPVEDVYKEVRNLRKTDETLRVVSMPIFAFGNISKGGGKYTPRYAQFNNGWRVIPFDELSTLYISGEQITDDGQSGPACMDMTAITSSITVHYEPPAAEIVRDVESLAAIAHMSFNNKITVDTDHGYNSSNVPYINLLGNPEYPVDNFPDAVTIAGDEFSNIHVRHNATISVADVGGFSITGDNAIRTRLTIADAAIADNVEIKEATITGVLDGNTIIRACLIDGITYFNGMIHQCAISQAPIVLGGTEPALFMECYAFNATQAPCIIDFDNGNNALVMRSFTGGVKFINKSGPEFATISLVGGTLVVDTTSCTGGMIKVGGDGMVLDQTGADLPSGTYGGLTLINNTISNDSVADHVWEYLMEAGFTAADMMRVKSAALAGKASGAGTGTMTYKGIDGTTNRIVATVDGTGNRTAVIVDGD